MSMIINMNINININMNINMNIINIISYVHVRR